MSDEYIREHCREYVQIFPDSVIFRDTLISLSCPMLMGLGADGKKMLIPFFKRCTGCVIIETRATKKEIEAFRSLNRNSPDNDRSDHTLYFTI